MLDHVVRQQVELAPTAEESTGVFYLPRSNAAGKSSGVFDSSSNEGNGPSLNDALEMGPNLFPEVLATLLRFREQPVAIIGGIQQVFLHLSLDRNVRDLRNFLWYRIFQDDEGNHYTTNEVVTHRFTRLPFVITCSPFLLSVTVRELATMCREKCPKAAPPIDSHLFMDDFLAGVADGNKAIGIYYELTAMMKTIKLPMGKWATSFEELKEIWKPYGQEIQKTTQALGVDWHAESDTLSVDVRDISDKTTKGPATKKQLLETTTRFYGPVGLFSPVSAIGKILFQETWCRGLQWEGFLFHDIGARWHAWINSLPLLSSIHIPRRMKTSNGRDTQMHVFCDASETAYGAVLYARSTTREGISVRLACSKNLLQ
jgi:hypothetical protein